MIVRNPDQRIAVLVDTQNLYYSAKNLYNKKINFRNLLNMAVQERTLIRAIAYVIEVDIEREAVFFEALNSAGFEVKVKPIQVFVGGAKKGDWDVGIAMDAVRLSQKMDSIVLVSGDGDFTPVVNYIQQSTGTLIEVMAFERTTNKALREMADDFINIEEYTNDLLFKG